jgi:hypothetical protein
MSAPLWATPALSPAAAAAPPGAPTDPAPARPNAGQPRAEDSVPPPPEGDSRGDGAAVHGRLGQEPYTDAREPITLTALSGITVLLALWALWLWATRDSPPPRKLKPRPEPRGWAWISPALFTALGALASWPAAISGSARMVGREFDLPGTIWFLSAAPRLLGARIDPLTGFPHGADYGRADSFVWTITGWALQVLDPVLLSNLAQVLAPALSGWAAEVAARRFGARAPWSALAGIGFAFAGPTATALFEGHTYLAVTPFLPLCLWSVLALTGPEPRLRHGVVFGLCWAGALWSSVYMGFCATLIGAWFGGPALIGRRLARGPTLAAAGLVLAGGLPYVGLFVGGGAVIRPSNESMETWDQRLDFVQRGSGGLLSLLPPSPELDAFYHGMSLYPLFSVAALALLAPRVLRGEPGTSALLALAGTSAVIAVGPLIRYAYVDQLTTPAALLYLLPGAEAMRFPMRFGWVLCLALGVLAARVASRLSKAPGLQAAPGRPSPLHLVWLLVLIDLTVALGMPGRQRSMPAGTNAALATATGPVFDVYPRLRMAQDDLNAWFQANDCLQQHDHGQAIADHCASRFAPENPRLKLQEELTRGLRSGQDPLPTLRRMGFAHVALHADLLADEELAGWKAALEASDPQPADDAGGGERILLYDLAPAP